jgi:hypothetical protein
MNNDIESRLKRIEAKLDAVIKALHEYDDDSYGESSFETFMDTKTNVLNWGVDGAERRMDIIGQNGNEGLHYTDVDENEFDDYGKRIIKEIVKDSSDSVEKSWMDAYHDDYLKLLASGMFFELHPTWTGRWENDKFAFTYEHKFSNKTKKAKDNNTQPKQKQYYKNKNSKRNENKK